MSKIPKLGLLYAFFAAQSLWATPSPETIRLLKKDDRPKMTQVHAALDHLTFDQGIPIQRGKGATYIDKRLDVASWTSSLIHRAAELIPVFESTYPNAKWIFIGRDSAAVADVFDAFYQSLGKNYRVVTLGVSKKSFEDITDEKLFSYLRSLGVDPDKASPASPLILVDSISSGGGRQSRHILASLLTEYIRRHPENETINLPRSINFLGLRVSTTGAVTSVAPSELLTAHARLESLMKQARSLLHSGQAWQFIYSGFPLVAIEEAPNHANEAGYSHFIGAWHDSYGAFGDSNSPERGQPFHSHLRQSILWTQKQIWNAMLDGSFEQHVRLEAKKLGTRFETLFGVESCQAHF